MDSGGLLQAKCCIFFKMRYCNSDILTVETWETTELDVHQGCRFVPEKHFRKQKNATDGTETDLKMGESRGLAAADSGPSLQLVYTL